MNYARAPIPIIILMNNLSYLQRQIRWRISPRGHMILWPSVYYYLFFCPFYYSLNRHVCISLNCRFKITMKYGFLRVIAFLIIGIAVIALNSFNVLYVFTFVFLIKSPRVKQIRLTTYYIPKQYILWVY